MTRPRVPAQEEGVSTQQTTKLPGKCRVVSNRPTESLSRPKRGRKEEEAEICLEEQRQDDSQKKGLPDEEFQKDNQTPDSAGCATAGTFASEAAVKRDLTEGEVEFQLVRYILKLHKGKRTKGRL